MKNEIIAKVGKRIRKTIKSMQVTYIDISSLIDSSDKKDYANKIMHVSNAIIKK